MIERLTNSDLTVAQKIRSVFQLSYRVEAELLNATDFPPLKRPLEDYTSCDTEFFGCSREGVLAGIIEISDTSSFTYINSLVVDPSFFRQGIASELLSFAFKAFDSNLFFVETGVENHPAIALYKKFGFKEVKQWDTDHGIRKVKFELRVANDEIGSS